MTGQGHPARHGREQHAAIKQELHSCLSSKERCPKNKSSPELLLRFGGKMCEAIQKIFFLPSYITKPLGLITLTPAETRAVLEEWMQETLYSWEEAWIGHFISFFQPDFLSTWTHADNDNSDVFAVAKHQPHLPLPLLGPKLLGGNKNQSSFCSTVGAASSLASGWEQLNAHFAGWKLRRRNRIQKTFGKTQQINMYSSKLYNSTCNRDHLFTSLSLNTCSKFIISSPSLNTCSKSITSSPPWAQIPAADSPPSVDSVGPPQEAIPPRNREQAKQHHPHHFISLICHSNSPVHSHPIKEIIIEIMLVCFEARATLGWFCFIQAVTKAATDACATFFSCTKR